ncbi:galectin-4-like [Homarus americanus]|uniref:Galectin n=1 Tax=Homarus americanus TaxID=6706 RepID=A0A8J5JLL6_HOMAM|nr:galectin-4-like [Homarus americanus]XP_042203415.1 galectin-4-like [Homarus americanus]KAG7156598.1 galectin-like [Homarus americanus]
MAAPIYNPGAPYLAPIPGGFSPGKIAHVTGTFTTNANSFILKLQSGPTGDPTDEIGLCMYGRVVEGVVGRNSFTRAMGWGQEEATNTLALARGQNFDVTIMCDPINFKIAINHDHFAEFNHRTNPATMTYLNIASTSQDMNLACVWIEDSSPPPYAQMAPVGPHYPPISGYEPPPPYSGGPGYSQPFPNQQMYQQSAPPGQYGQAPPPQHSSGSSGKGMLGMVAGAGTAVAGALGASHLIGKSKTNGGYPSSGGSGGGLLNKALGMGGAVGGASMLGGSKGMMGGKAMKYGVPLAGLGALGAGGYMMSKGIGHGFHGSSSSSSGGSSEEE